MKTQIEAVTQLPCSTLAETLRADRKVTEIRPHQFRELPDMATAKGLDGFIEDPGEALKAYGPLTPSNLGIVLRVAWRVVCGGTFAATDIVLQEVPGEGCARGLVQHQKALDRDPQR